MAELLAYVVSGLVTGSVLAVMASGLVLTHAATGVFNFAHGAIGFATAFLYFQLHTGAGLPAPVALAVAVGLFALPWLSGMGETMTLPELSEYAGDEAFTMPEMYVKWLAYVMLALQLLYSLAWTLGAIRTQTIAKLMVTWPNSELTHASFTRYRLLFGFSLSCSFLVHGLGVLTVYEGHFDLAGAGPWVVLAGTVLTVIASFIGPRKGPGLPPS